MQSEVSCLLDIWSGFNGVLALPKTDLANPVRHGSA